MTDSLDTQGGLREPPTKYQIHLHTFIELFQLSDVWRYLYIVAEIQTIEVSTLDTTSIVMVIPFAGIPNFTRHATWTDWIYLLVRWPSVQSPSVESVSQIA